MIKVKLTQTAFIGMRRIKKGETIMVDEKKFSEKFMIKLDKDGKAAEAKTEKKADKPAKADKKADKPVI